VVTFVPAAAADVHKQPKDRAHRSPTKAKWDVASGDDNLASSVGTSTKNGMNEEDEDDDYDDVSKMLPHGMADLRTAMTVKGTSAFWFAEAVDAFDIDDDWADEYGAFVASLHDEEMVLTTALSPSAKAQAYLALLPSSDFFVVLHGLHRWVTTPPSRSENEGKLVAFKKKTLGEDGREPPDLLRFDGDKADLFKLLSLSTIDLVQVANFYDGSF
jgi:hypothetical protein